MWRTGESLVRDTGGRQKWHQIGRCLGGVDRESRRGAEALRNDPVAGRGVGGLLNCHPARCSRNLVGRKPGRSRRGRPFVLGIDGQPKGARSDDVGEDR